MHTPNHPFTIGQNLNKPFIISTFAVSAKIYNSTFIVYFWFYPSKMLKLRCVGKHGIFANPETIVYNKPNEYG